MDQSISLLETYRRMAATKVTDKFITKILKSRLPAKVLPDYLKEEEAKLPNITEWQLYNDITELIWHNEKTGLHSKTFQFNTLHSITPLTPRRV
jgi:hypothetical protein